MRKPSPEMVKEYGRDKLEDYAVAMIEANYCARQGLNLAQISHSSQPNYPENMVAGPGFELDKESALKDLQLLTIRQFKSLKGRKSA